MQRGHGTAERLLAGGMSIASLFPPDSFSIDGEENADMERRIVLNDSLGPKRFGKMFPEAEPFQPPDEALQELGSAMGDSGARDADLPAGFTYLGQFIDHDITFDKTLGFPPIEDPDLIDQARTPNLDLDSLYGLGPQIQPELYEPDAPGRARFKIGTTVPVPENGLPDPLPNDLPRDPVHGCRAAIIADSRNDENLVIAQTALLFLKFHNRVHDTLPKPPDGKNQFGTVSRLVRWHYQWIILNDFLPRVIDQEILKDIRAYGRKFYTFDREPGGRLFMPLEFSVAAYRFGHSLIRNGYDHNRVFPNATLAQLFTFTGGGGFAGQVVLPANWIIDWRRFYEVDDPGLLNVARKIDTKLAATLHDLPCIPADEPVSLAVRNLLRGSRFELPAGQDVAELMGITPLKPDELASGSEGEIVRKHGFHERTPLWFYILKEAEVHADGNRLGAVGSRIVGEVFVGLLEGDPRSFLRAEPGWTPTLPAESPGDFTMADLLRFVDDINPIGP